MHLTSDRDHNTPIRATRSLLTHADQVGGIKVKTDRGRRQTEAPGGQPHKPTIGILGGMGPIATADFHLKLVRTSEASSDQDFPNILVVSDTSTPDRSDAILGRGPSPRSALVENAKFLEKAGADNIIIACNTAHAFLDPDGTLDGIVIENIVEAASEEAALAIPLEGTVAVCGTRGLLSTGLYQSALAKHGCTCITPSNETQILVDHLIADIKSGRVDDELASHWRFLVDRMASAGAHAVVMGCTEIPIIAQTTLVELPLIDPAEAVSRRILRMSVHTSPNRLRNENSGSRA